MTDPFDDRRRALEEEYFKRKDREAAKAKGEDVVTMNCPRCDGRLHEITFDDVRIDRCDKCHGVWLDSGELEEIVKQEDAPGRWLRVLWPGRTRERSKE